MQVEATQSMAYQPSQQPSQTKAFAPEVEKTDSVIQFKKDPVSGNMMMSLVDPKSGDVIRQIPKQELVDISRVLGLLFDRVA